MSEPAVAALDRAVAALSGIALSSLDPAALLALVEALEIQARRLASVGLGVVGELDARKVAGAAGAASTADLLVRRIRVSPAEAKARVARAAELTPRTTILGEALPALFAEVARSAGAGEISVEHAGAIAGVMDRLPSSLDATSVEVVEHFLVDAARHEHPGALRRTGELLLTRFEPDDPREPDAQRRDRSLVLQRCGDGTSRLRGTLNVEATAVWTAVLDSLAAPAPSTAGEPDPRSAGQRRHDALVDAGRRLLRSGELSPAGGVPVTVLVRTTAAELRAGRGVALTDRGEPWPIPDLLAACSDAELVPVLLDDAGAVRAVAGRPAGVPSGRHGGAAVVAAPSAAGGAQLWQGRARRLATRAQRLALAARDGGCTFPGCDRPAAWAEAHHVIAWQDGGATDIDNLTLVCRHHHRTFEADGWSVQMNGGVPEWTPPRWLDPARRPQRNHVHRPPEMIFALPHGCSDPPRPAWRD